MNVLIQRSHNVNGAISGRGLRHRRLSLEQRKQLAAEVATGERQLEPSLAQISAAFGITPLQLREELKARAIQSAPVDEDGCSHPSLIRRRLLELVDELGGIDALLDELVCVTKEQVAT